ncbi:YybH family protein [Ferrimonas marina]|uniref:DUF4440 domain-containing protein n=1 Tax=Ferrimonas marina TaxID=299255 RepID=A0A1M5N8S1_9GAMM|nr:nuclear transport factor 2 family protein [Ferrimonas marina]SHG85901.1 conserved hypothetical protein [Ferrimonas marina]
MQFIVNDTLTITDTTKLRTPMFKDTPQVQEILEMERKLYRALATKDLDALAAGLDENGLLFDFDGQILRGREQQMAMFKAFLELEDAAFEWEPVEAFVSDSQDMAWAWGLANVKLPGQKTEVFKYNSVWQKRDGRWQNVSEMRNPFRG